MLECMWWVMRWSFTFSASNLQAAQKFYLKFIAKLRNIDLKKFIQPHVHFENVRMASCSLQCGSVILCWLEMRRQLSKWLLIWRLKISIWSQKELHRIVMSHCYERGQQFWLDSLAPFNMTTHLEARFKHLIEGLQSHETPITQEE